MADLIETDEEVEKAGKGLIPRGGSKRMLRNVAATGRGGRKTPQYTMARYLASRTGQRSKLRADRDGYQRLKKSTDPLSTLYAEIEKARGKVLHGSSSAKPSNLEYGRKLHAAGKAKRNEALRQKAIAAGKKLLGRKIYL